MPYINPFAASPITTSPEETSALTNPFAGAMPEGGGGGIIDSITGLPGAVVSGIGDVVGGVVGLIGAGIHDLGKTVANVIPGEQTVGVLNDQDSYRLDDIGMGLVGFGAEGWDPAKYGITGDLWRRYSPLLPGGNPASETFRMLAEEPVSFALDALSIASFGGTAAVGFGSKAVEAAGLGGAAATRVAEVTSMLGKAGFGISAARRAGIRAGLDVIADSRALSATEAFARKMLPEATLSRVGEKLIPTVTAKNPLTRITAGALTKHITTESISVLAARVDDLKAAVDEQVALVGGDGAVQVASKTMLQTAADYRLAKQMLDEAQAAGVTKLATDKWASSAARRVARRLGGEMNAQSLFRRTERMKQVEATLQPWLDVDPTIQTRAAGLWQRLDVELLGETPAHWAGRPLEFEGLGSRQVALGSGPSIPLRLSIEPAVRAALPDEAGTMLAKTDGVVHALEATRQRWMENPQLEELGYNVADEVDSIDRLIDHLNDAVDRRVASQRNAVTADPALLAMDDMRLLNLAQSQKLWEQPGINGVITPTGMLDRAYMPLRVKYGAKYIGDGFEGGPSTKQIDDALRAHGEAAPIYFSHMDPAELGAWDFFTSKKRVGGARLAQDPNLRRNEAKLLERGSYLTDPMEVFSRRAARAVRAEETYRTLMSYSTRLGRRIDDLNDLGTNEVLFAPEILRMGKRTSVRVQDLVDDMTSSGVSREEAVAKAVEDVVRNNSEELSTLLASGHKTQLFAVPKAAADQLNNAAKIAGFATPKGSLAFYDSAMQAWRQLTLFTRPAYVTNQFLGNTAFALMQGSGLKAPMAILSRRFVELLAKKTGRSIDDAVLNNLESLPGFEELGGSFFGALSMQYEARNAGFAASRTGRAVARAGETRAARIAKRFMVAERNAAVEIDNAFRASGYVSAAEKAMGMGVVHRTFSHFRGLQHRIDRVLKGGFGDDPAVVTQALDEAKFFFGDYASMGPFARHVTRRYLFPWWGFTRHNINLMARFPIEYPARAEILLALERVDEEYKAQYGEIPEWLNGAVPLGPPGAEVNFLSMRGGSPFEGVLQPWTSQLAPLPKMAIERATGRNMYTGEQFSDPDIITPFGSDQPYRIIRDDAGNAIGVEPVEGNVLPGFGEHLLRQFPIYTYAERFAAGDASTYDSATLAGLLQGEGIKYDETGQPLGQEGTGEVLAALLGLPVAEYNLAQYRERVERERQSALSAAQNRILEGV